MESEKHDTAPAPRRGERRRLRRAARSPVIRLPPADDASDPAPRDNGAEQLTGSGAQP